MNTHREVNGGQRLCTFVINDLLLGIDVMRVQEINRQRAMTRVPLAPSVIRGIINMRGQIVMAIDLRKRLGLPAGKNQKPPVNVVVSIKEGVVSLIVDEIGDVAEVSEDCFEPHPATLPHPLRNYLHGLYNLPNRTLLVLDIDRVSNLENLANENN